MYPHKTSQFEIADNISVNGVTNVLASSFAIDRARQMSLFYKLTGSSPNITIQVRAYAGLAENFGQIPDNADSKWTDWVDVVTSTEKDKWKVVTIDSSIIPFSAFLGFRIVGVTGNSSDAEVSALVLAQLLR